MGSASSDTRKALLKTYRGVLEGYVPGSYPGRVTLFWPREESAKAQDDPTMGWARVTREVSLHTVPGKHLTCITTHVQALADRLRRCLSDADAA